MFSQNKLDSKKHYKGVYDVVDANGFSVVMKLVEGCVSANTKVFVFFIEYLNVIDDGYLK